MDLKETTLSIPQETILAIIEQYHLFLTKDQVSVRAISQLIEKLCYSIIAVYSAPLHNRQQIIEF